MLTAEKAHLLLTRPDGRSESPSHHGIALAAAALADLRQAGVVRIEETPLPAARVWAVTAGTAGHPVLDALLPAVDRLSGTRLAAAVAKGRPDARRPVTEHLVETGELEVRTAFLDTRRVPRSPATRAGLVEQLSATARGEREASAEDTLLLGLLKHLNVAHRLLSPAADGEDRREAGRRLESMTREDTLVQAVCAAVAGPLAGVTAAAAGAEPLPHAGVGAPALG